MAGRMVASALVKHDELIEKRTTSICRFMRVRWIMLWCGDVSDTFARAEAGREGDYEKPLLYRKVKDR